MRVVHNPSAINSHRNLSSTNRALSKNLERMSSGLRINRASDDAAGLAIAQRVDTQVLGLEQGIRNTLDGISVIQTAESGMQEIQAMLQRMRVLAIESANGSASAADREMIQAEIDQLLESVDSQAKAVEFNAMKLLTGDFSKDAPAMYKAGRSSYERARDDSKTIDIYATFSNAGFEKTDGVTQLSGKVDTVNDDAIGGFVEINDARFSLSDYDSVNDFMQAINESVQANATITYDVLTDRFSIVSDTPETPLRLYQSAGSGITPFFTAARIDTGTTTAPGPRAQAISQYEAANQTNNAVGTLNTHILDLEKGWASAENQGAGFDTNVDGTVAINGVQFSVADYATVREFMNAINNHAEADVTIEYDVKWDQFTITRDTVGKDMTLSAVSGNNNFFYEISILDREGENEITGNTGWETNGDSNSAKVNNSNVFRAPTWHAMAESLYEVRQDDKEAENNSANDPVQEIIKKDKVNLNYGVNDTGQKVSANFNSLYSVAWQGKFNRDLDGDGNTDNAALAERVSSAWQNDYATHDAGTAVTVDFDGVVAYNGDQLANFDRDITGSITVNNATFSIAKYNNVNELMAAVNASDDANATMGYDTINDKFWIRSDDGSDLFLAEHKSTAGYGFFEEANIKAGPDGTTYKHTTPANENWRFEGMVFHVGANKDQVVATNIATISTKSLKIDVLKDNGVTTSFASESAIRLLRDAIDSVSMERANLGAIQNRLEHHLNYNEIAHENQTASLSRIRDLDFAEESIVFVKNQILLQSSTAMLAQANALPQNVLALIG
ncbi:MAG: flagellin [bacterium]|nr:flagellin [bacterium]